MLLKIFAKICKYAGLWNTSVFKTAESITNTTTAFDVNVINASLCNYIDGDILTVIIEGVRMNCIFTSKNASIATLTIASSSNRVATIPANSVVKVLKHLTSQASEDLVTKFETNRQKIVHDKQIQTLQSNITEQTTNYEKKLSELQNTINNKLTQLEDESPEWTDL